MGPRGSGHGEAQHRLNRDVWRGVGFIRFWVDKGGSQRGKICEGALCFMNAQER